MSNPTTQFLPVYVSSIKHYRKKSFLGEQPNWSILPRSPPTVSSFQRVHRFPTLPRWISSFVCPTPEIRWINFSPAVLSSRTSVTALHGPLVPTPRGLAVRAARAATSVSRSGRPRCYRFTNNSDYSSASTPMSKVRSNERAREQGGSFPFQAEREGIFFDSSVLEGLCRSNTTVTVTH